MSRQIPDELKEKALSMLQTEDIDTVAATLRIRKAALEKMMKDEAMDIAPPAAEPMRGLIHTFRNTIQSSWKRHS